MEFSSYIDELLVPTEAEEARIYSLASLETPQEAVKRLTSLGYTQDIWHDLLERRQPSHSIRAEILTAMGSIARCQTILELNLRALDVVDGVSRDNAGLDVFFSQPEIHSKALNKRIAQLRST